MRRASVSLGFFTLGLGALLAGLLFGLLANLQIIHPQFFKSFLPFNQMRPLHVTSMVAWIVLTATGGIYHYSTRILNKENMETFWAWVHLLLFALCGVAIYLSYFFLKMGGREYLNFPPVLILPIFAGWLIFAFRFFSSHWGKEPWPVYTWMWGTGIVFMMFHLGEAYLWLIPQVRAYFIRDMTIQWKAYGSFVGSWNMLVYGTAIFLMARLKKDSSVATSPKAFFFYFLGLTNLMFGWAHHTYLLPNATWIRAVAYVISMTEWVVFLHILYQWFKSPSSEESSSFKVSVLFLKAADLWIFLNLLMALLMSIPAIQFYTHGTYITVAHSMGTTIGINSMILIASLFFALGQGEQGAYLQNSRPCKRGFWIFNASFLGFWVTLIATGLIRASMMNRTQALFGQVQNLLKPAYVTMFVFGLGMTVGVLMLVTQLASTMFSTMRK